ncbi:MAG: outer membrane protein assembly factor BamB family protein [Acidimicrobiia bacterium]
MAGFVRRVALVGIVVALTGCWAQYRGDPGHSGNQPLEFGLSVANAPALGTVWTAPTGGAVDTAPTVSSGTAYVGAGDGKLYAFDAAGSTGCSGSPATCAPLWTAAVPGGAIRTSPSVWNGVVYVQGRDKLYAFDAAGGAGCSGSPKTCTPLWTSTALGDVLSSPTVLGGSIYVTGTTGLAVFDEAAGAATCSGNPKVCGPTWRSQAFTPSRDASPAVVGGRVFVTGDATLYSYDAAGVQGCSGAPKTCAPLWKAGNADSAPAVAGGRVYVASRTGALRVFDANGVVGCSGAPLTCAPQWTTDVTVGAGTTMEPPSIANGRAFVAVDGSVVVFDATGSTGCSGSPTVCTPLWRSDTGGLSVTDVVVGAPALANGVVYTGGHERLRAYDAAGTANCAAAPKRCDPIWTSGPGGAGFAAPVVVGGTVYAGTGAGLRAYQPVGTAGPTISAVAPFATRGQTTRVHVVGGNFAPGFTLSSTIPGATLGSPASVTPTSFMVDVTVAGTVTPGAYALHLTNPDGRVATRSITVATAAGAAVAARAGIAGYPGILWQPAEQRDAQLSEIAEAGATWTALDLDWKSVQETPTDDSGWTRGTFGNGGFDGAVKAANARGLKVLGIITYSPAWARDLTACPDLGDNDVGHCFPDVDHVQAFGNFAAAAAARYGSNASDPALRNTITAWQIWNEPNNPEFAGTPDPARYTAMLAAAYPAIHRADPTATVVTGGTAPGSDADPGWYSPVTWLNDLYADGAAGTFDAVGHHPYSFPGNPLDPYSEVWNAYSQTVTLHDIMATHGDGAKKVWGTEMGSATGSVVCDPSHPENPCSLSDADQAQWTHDYYWGWNNPDYHGFPSITGPLIVKAIRDNSSDPFSIFDNLGLVHVDGTPKPAYGSYRQFTTNGFG